MRRSVAVPVLAVAGVLASGAAARPDGGAATRHLEYVFAAGAMYVYDIDHRNRLVRRVPLPGLVDARGAALSPRTQMLYVSFGGQGGSTGTGSLLAYDLARGRIAWQRHYATGTDRIAITRDGRTIYMPVGEASGSGAFELVDARTGRVTGAVVAGGGAHDAVMGADGRRVYLGGVEAPYLAVASTSTNRIVRTIGPLKSGGRPFALNRAQTIAYTTAEYLLGFQVSDVATGKVRYTVGVPGFPYDPATFHGSSVVCHGIALSRDETRLYLVDTAHGYVHVFDVAGGLTRAPRLVASVKLRHNPYSRAWLQLSRDGRYLYVGSSGDVIDTRTLRVVGDLQPLGSTGDMLEIDWRLGRAVT